MMIKQSTESYSNRHDPPVTNAAVAETNAAVAETDAAVVETNADVAEAAPVAPSVTPITRAPHPAEVSRSDVSEMTKSCVKAFLVTLAMLFFSGFFLLSFSKGSLQNATSQSFSTVVKQLNRLNENSTTKE